MCVCGWGAWGDENGEKYIKIGSKENGSVCVVES